LITKYNTELNRSELIDEFYKNHQLFKNYILSLNEEEYNYAPPEKWTAGQHLDHLIRAIKPLTQAMILPNFVLKTMFGKANRQSKTYTGLVRNYQEKLEEGGRASGKFLPPPQSFEDRSKLINQFQNLISKLKKQIDNYSEASLDELILPHPLLGKLTLREMLYFTAYHATHHQRLVEKYLSYKG